ncbi:hypothetical protein [Yoonia sp. 2307UL14-13]|uniref:hypothetical protein n=1 Tax=Yoonia sp. 2307UL14-13 TaxID=3126506 RepID=UPI0030B63605
MLITVLWISLALLLAVAAFLATARQEALGVRAEVGAARAVALARSGLNVALADLGRINPDQARSPLDGTPVTLNMAEGTVIYRLQDETGKIDILNAPRQLIAPALVLIAEAEGVDAFDAVTVADAIADFAAEPDGSIGSVYAALTRAGFSARTANIAGRYLTTLNFTAQVNPRTAPRVVLQAIPGLGPSDVEEIMARRADGQPLPRLGSAALWLSERAGPVYTIEAEAILATGARAVLQAQVAQRGVAFRGGLMQYEILSVRQVR